MSKIKFIPFEYKSGKENMDIDERILEEAIQNSSTIPTFRLYGWEPACVSLGRNQKDDFLDKIFLAEKNIDIVEVLCYNR